MTLTASPFERLRLTLQRVALMRLQSLRVRTDRLRHRKPAAPHIVTGHRGEFEALFFLRRQGFAVVERRWRTSGLNGDLDLIAWEGDTLCFVEVKARTQRDLYPAAYAVDAQKERMLRRMARAYLRTLPAVQRYTVARRFDVVSVYLLDGVVNCELKRAAFEIEEANSRPAGV